ncbi:MAG: cobalamin biosynthesis protein [Paracoccaceae bacterium]|nr:cobalamin biosynthesis protein [Paracoccaceae bacterium]MDE3239776.1 cobalamin biosynthesis protein [Paracoccaceae bacterium]
MRVAGIGFRRNANLASLKAALDEAGTDGLSALATVESKADAPALQALANMLGLPIQSIAQVDLARQTVLTHSPRVTALVGAGSLAEAAALAGAGLGARLLGPRVQSPDGMATAAIAERTER